MIAAAERRVLLGPEDLHHLDGLVSDGASLLKGYAEGVVFLLYSAYTQAKDNPSAGSYVQRRHHLGQPYGVMIGQHQHRGTKPYPGGHGREVGKHGQRLIIGPASDALTYVPYVEQVLADPHRVESQLLRLGANAHQGAKVLYT